MKSSPLSIFIIGQIMMPPSFEGFVFAVIASSFLLFSLDNERDNLIPIICTIPVLLFAFWSIQQINKLNPAYAFVLNFCIQFIFLKIRNIGKKKKIHFSLNKKGIQINIKKINKEKDRREESFCELPVLLEYLRKTAKNKKHKNLLNSIEFQYRDLIDKVILGQLTDADFSLEKNKLFANLIKLKDLIEDDKPP